MTIELKIIIIVFIVMFAIFLRRLFHIIFKDNEMKKAMKRQAQLTSFKSVKDKKSEDDELRDLLKTVSSPFEKTLFKRYRVTEKPSFRFKLEFSGADKYFPTAVSFYSANAFLCFALFILGSIISMSAGSFLPLVVLEVLAIVLPTFLLNNKNKKKSEALFYGFPDFIRICEGYLIAGMTFPVAVEESIPYVDDSWKPLLKQFIIDCDLKSQEYAIDNLKNSIPNFEIKEFLALVKLNMEQGINIKECFDRQSERIKSMQKTAMLGKIKKREMMGVLIQAPLLISIFVAFGLPVVDSFMKIGM